MPDVIVEIGPEDPDPIDITLSTPPFPTLDVRIKKESSGADTGRLVKHDFADGFGLTSNSYIGTAPLETPTDAPSWVITKLEISGGGTTITKKASGIAWDDRYIGVYV